MKSGLKDLSQTCIKTLPLKAAQNGCQKFLNYEGLQEKKIWILLSSRHGLASKKT